MKKIICFLTIILLTSSVYAETANSLSIGFGGGYSSHGTFRGELYLKSDIRLFNRNSEIKFGINNHSYQLTFDNVSNLNASSIGFFGDIAIFPFDKGLFAGIRWEAINFNWLSNESRDRIRAERGYEPISLYTGTSIFFQIGYKFKISDKLAIRLYGQPGFQQFRITNGSTSSGSFVQNPSGNPIVENHVKFIYNINLSLEIRL